MAPVLHLQPQNPHAGSYSDAGLWALTLMAVSAISAYGMYILYRWFTEGYPIPNRVFQNSSIYTSPFGSGTSSSGMSQLSSSPTSSSSPRPRMHTPPNMMMQPAFAVNTLQQQYPMMQFTSGRSSPGMVYSSKSGMQYPGMPNGQQSSSTMGSPTSQTSGMQSSSAMRYPMFQTPGMQPSSAMRYPMIQVPGMQPSSAMRSSMNQYPVVLSSTWQPKFPWR